MAKKAARTRSKPSITQVATKIKKLQELGWTQSQIGEVLGLSQPMVSLLKAKRLKKPDKLGTYYTLLDALVNESSFPQKNGGGGNGSTRQLTFAEWLTQQMDKYAIDMQGLSAQSGVHLLTISYILNGKTASPQDATRRKLANAITKLRPVEKAGQTQDDPPPTAAKDEFYMGIRYIEDEIKQAPAKVGVYVIHDDRGFPTYIGQGNIQKRLKAHAQNRAFVDNRVAATFSYLVLQQGDSEQEKKKAHQEAVRMERLLIKFAGTSVLLNRHLVEDVAIG